MRLVSKCLLALTLVLALASVPAARPEAGGKLKMSSGYGKSFHRGGFKYGGKRSFRHHRGFKRNKFFSKRNAFLKHSTRHRLKRRVYGKHGTRFASRRFSPIVPPFGSDARHLTFDGGRHGAYGHRDRRRGFGSQAGLSRNSPIVPPFGSDARHVTFDGGRHRDFGHNGRRHGAFGHKDRRRGFGSQAGLSPNSPIVPPFGSDARHITFDGGRNRDFGHKGRHRNAAFEHNGYRDAAFEGNGYRDAAFERNGRRKAAFGRNAHRNAAFGSLPGPTRFSPIVPPFGSGAPQLDFGGRKGSVLVLKGSHRSVVHSGKSKARGGQIARVSRNDGPALPIVQYGYRGD